MAMRSGLMAAILAIGCPGDAPYGAKPSPDPEPEAEPDPKAEPTDAIRERGNHLLGEASPYLEQHAHNPVDWYPWGDAALAKAKAERKPIFLSIGYSTCHWCHVMEKESFEDDTVAAFLNEHFVAIKVDREQRPDIDAIYIDAVAALGGSTGWPLNVFLTPDLAPFFGGTYYPKEGRHGRPGFTEVLQQVHDMWTKEGDAVAAKGRDVLAQIEKRALLSVKVPGQVDAALIDTAMTMLVEARDPGTGGFGGPQKFPSPPLLLAELRYFARTSDSAAKDHVVLTLDQMLAGGIRDHVGGSFHRYAVDRRWHVPHFEKTLYDNAQLAALYIEAGRTLARDDYVAAGRAVLDDLVAHWRGAGEAFVVGFDADDPNGEGAFYSWTPAELVEVLGEADAAVIAAVFGVDVDGDPQLHGRSVLHRENDDAIAKQLGLDVATLRAKIDAALPRLREVRDRRPPPARDDKVLVAWNGLAIMALADAGRWLGEPRYVQAAIEAATFVVDRCWKDGRMQRGFRGDAALGPGFLDDHALAALGLVRLHAATGDLRWLVAAREITATILRDFHDAKHSAFMRTPADPQHVPVRMVDMDDGVMPGGGSAAALLALELGAIAGDEELYAIGRTVLERSAGYAKAAPRNVGFLLVVVDHAIAPVREVVVAGDDDAASLWAEVAPTSHARFLPVRLPAAGFEGPGFPALAGKRALKGKPTAFVCERGSCQAPTSDPAKLRQQLALH
jgi:uncharacterized protein YyaL (SSP411 family)